ncbi:MAG: hypothetical protein AAFX55_01455 [Bacteroidota bacterium]
MKTLYKFRLLALCFFMGTALGIAQDADMDWSAESYIVSIDTQEVAIASNLDKASSTFTWEQISNLSTRTIQYTVTTSSGQWDVQQQTGQLDYTLTSDGDSATLSVLGTSEGITMTFTVLDGNGNAFKTFEFDIDSFSNL